MPVEVLMTERKAGRPPIGDVKLTRCTVYLLPDQVLAAHSLGHGNVSDGLRQQLHDLAAFQEWNRARLQKSASEAPAPRSRHQ